MKNIIKRVSLIVLAIAISLSIVAFNIGNKALYIAGLFVTCLSIYESPIQIIESGRKITNLELVKDLINCSKRVIKEKYDLWQ